MKSFGTALILTSVASAVNVQKARINPAYAAPTENNVVHHEPAYEVVEHPHVPVAVHNDYESPVYEVVGEPYVTDAPQEEHYSFDPAPRYWDDHLHYKGPTWVDFTTPEPYVAAPVEHALPEYLPYIPKYKNHYVDVEQKHSYNDFGDLFTPYDFYAPPEEDLYGDPIYEPKHDKLHQKQPKKEAPVDIHDHSKAPEAPEHEEEEHHEPEYHGEEEHHEVYREEYSHCDCSDVAAERDAAIIERDDAVSKLYLYALAYGDILPEPAHPVYEAPAQDETSTTYDPEYTYYQPYSTLEENYDDIPEHHETSHHEEPEEHHYKPTEEEVNYFDQDDYSPEGYGQHKTDDYSYLDYVLNSYNDGYENYAEPDYGYGGHGNGYESHDDYGHNDGHHESDNHHGNGYGGDAHGHGH